MPHDKFSKILSKFPSWKTLKGSEIRSNYSNKTSEMLQDKRMFNFWDVSGQTDVSNKETDLRKKSLLSWQNIFNSRQIAADIEEKLTNQGKVFRKGISHIYLSISTKWKPCHGAINSRPRNLRAALEKYFPFQRNCKQTAGWSEEQDSKLWDLFPHFLWNYSYNSESAFTGWS